ncbi:MAG: hypothetical protein WCV84_00015 [Patescibacteria group bacterium]
MKYTQALVACFIAMAIPLAVFARIGVGVGNGTVRVTEKLHPGITYRLPIFSVVNTGDEKTYYEATVEFMRNIPELRPGREWFAFSPDVFVLEPGKVQNVEVIITVPLRAQPGDYFAFLQAHPTVKVKQPGQTAVGIAAAGKLYFTVEPASIWMAMYFRISSFAAMHRPWSYVIPGIIAFIGLIFILKRFIHIEIGVKK